MSREYKVGLFIICTTVIIFLALLYLAREKGFFTTVSTFTLSSKTGEGFTEGMPVVFSGFNIGKVHALELNDKGIVLIKIKIPQRHVKWIKADSSFVLYRPLIGAARIVVTTDNLGSPPMPENKIPEVAIINDINDAIEKVQPLLEKITQIAENLERGRILPDSLAHASSLVQEHQTKPSPQERPWADGRARRADGSLAGGRMRRHAHRGSAGSNHGRAVWARRIGAGQLAAAR